MFPLNLHVICREGYTGGMLRGVEIVFFMFLLRFSQIPGHEGPESAKISLSASLVDLDSLRRS